MVTIASAFILSLLYTRLLRDHPTVTNAIDHPNERSLHTSPTPRTGGIAILGSLGSVGVWLAFYGVGLDGLGIIVIATGVLVLGFIAFWDDRHTLQPFVRLFSHFTIAFWVLAWNGFFLPEPIERVVSSQGIWVRWLLSGGIVFAVVWMINLYNFMDGMDGFAGGMAIVGFGTYAIIGLLSASMGYARIMSVVVGACAGFLYYNFPPAKIFLGDVGSTTLGFGAAVAGLWGWKHGLFPLWAPIMIFSPFIMDATVTLMKRFITGKDIFQAHRTHYYQRLVQSGWGHRKTVLYEYCIMAVTSALVITNLFLPSMAQEMILIGTIIAYVLVFIRIEYSLSGDPHGI